MSQYNPKVLKIAALSALLGAATMPMSANAAMVTSQGQTAIYKTSFNEMDGAETAVMNWKNPTAEFTFDMADADWTDQLDLFISADPLGRVSSRTPLMVQLNNAKPIPIVTRGQGFDSRIRLDKSQVRPRRNKIKFTYKTPTGAECLLPEHGGWRLNFKESFVVVKARSKSRNYYLREVEAKLGNATTAPKTISLLARGQNTAKLQALAAQGIGMRMKTLPEFKTTKSNAEFEIVLGRRDELYNWVSDRKILDSTGPHIFVHEGRPMRLVITGDTDAEVLSLAGEFASRSLPIAQRSVTSLGELQFQPSFKDSLALIDGTTKISELGGTYFEDGWGPKAARLKFNVSDPAASSGEVLLRIASNKNVSDESRVSVTLNGKSLGHTKLNKSSKTVAFDISEGTLQGSDNVLTITPDLNLAKASGCNFQKQLPGFYLGEGSKIKIKTPIASPVAELSKMTATGAPFSINQGKDTVVVLPAGSSRDYAASLKVLAKLAKTSGGGWAEANYMRSTNYAALPADKNILFIGSSASFKGALRKSAPKALDSALKGQALTGTGRLASIDKFASNNEVDTIRLYAARQAESGRIRQGGVAALYASPLAGDKVLGIITNAPGGSFAKAANQMLQPTHWNSLEGSVSRWNKSNVLMAQTAISIPGFVTGAKSNALSRFSSGISWPEFEIPSFDMSFFSMEDFDTELAKSRLEDFRVQALTLLGGKKSGEAIPTVPRTQKRPIKTTAVSFPSYVPPQSKIVQISVPNLRRSIINNASEIKLELRGFSEVSQKSLDGKRLVGDTKSWITSKSDLIKKAWENRGTKSEVQTLNASLKASKTAKASNAELKSSHGRFALPSFKLGVVTERFANMSEYLLILIFGGFFLLLGLSAPNTVREEKK